MANIRNSISCLNMFERAVQDPCSHGCDTEDDTILQEQNQDEMDELDPLKEGISLNNDNDTNDYITKKNTRGRKQNKHINESRSSTPLIWNNPFGNGLDQFIHESPQQGMLLDKRKSSTFNGLPNNNLTIRRTRTNSSCYIQQQSRKPIRNSFNNKRKSTSNSTTNININNNNRKSLQYRSKSNNNIQKKINSTESDTPSVPSLRSRSNTTNDFMNNNCSNSRWVQPSSLSHSSCSSILSHLYGLEKYISSDLDALAVEDPNNNNNSNNINNNINLPNFGTYQNPNNSQSDLILTNYTNTTPISTNTPTSTNNTTEDFINGNKRQKSFIEQSLANSFSQ